GEEAADLDLGMQPVLHAAIELQHDLAAEDDRRVRLLALIAARNIVAFARIAKLRERRRELRGGFEQKAAAVARCEVRAVLQRIENGEAEFGRGGGIVKQSDARAAPHP